MFLTTRSSKLDHTWLYLDDIFKKIFLFVLEHFLFWDNFIMYCNILFDSGTICISGIFLTLTDLCDGMTIVAYAMSRHPRRRPRQASRLRALGPWRARHGRMDHTVSAEQVQLGRRERTWRKKYGSIHPCRMPKFHPHILMGPELWLPHLERWAKATDGAHGAVIYHFRWHFHLSLSGGYFRYPQKKRIY